MKQRDTKLRGNRNKNGLRDFVLNLAAACPIDQSNPDDCPLKHLREQKMAARLKWLRALSEDDLRYLAAYHQVCLTTKTLGCASRGR